MIERRENWVERDYRRAVEQREAWRAADAIRERMRQAEDTVGVALRRQERRTRYYAAAETWSEARAICVDCGNREKFAIDRCLRCDVPVCERCSRGSWCAVCVETDALTTTE